MNIEHCSIMTCIVGALSISELQLLVAYNNSNIAVSSVIDFITVSDRNISLRVIISENL